MQETLEPTSRLVILNKHPRSYVPRFRDIVISEPMVASEALELGQKAAEKLPLGVAGFAFIEGVTAPATVELDCDACNTRRQTLSIPMLKLLWGIE